ncbi:MAG: hypothetical protein ACI31S_01845 [Bacilli bacterium]
MALKIKNNFVREDIVDEKGNKLGELKFNPNDSRIMKTLSELVKDFSNRIKELDKLEKVEEIKKEDLKSIEDFENVSKSFETIDKALDIEVEAVDKMINGLSEIFGKDTIELFTQGTNDAECLLPIIEFIEPYVKQTRQNKVNKYLDNKNDVME